jgi:hypothetical protein
MTREIERLEDQLRRSFTGGGATCRRRHPPYTAYSQFIGITQHDLYHAGQIAMLKRALGPRTQNE